MNQIIDLYNQTPQGIIFLLAVFFCVYGLVLNRMLKFWYARNLEKNVEAFRSGYVSEINALRAKIKEYERTHRTMV